MLRSSVLGAVLASTSFLSLLGSPAFAADEADEIDNDQHVSTATEREIVGGANAPSGKWPDAVAVMGDMGTCTGTLIAPDVVLTAGHCAEINPTQVIANTTDYAGSGGTRVNVARTVAYPNWENTYDVSVVLLSQPISGITPRKIGTSCTFNSFASNTMVRLVGFGSTQTDGKGDNTLLKEAMTAVTDPMCSGGNGCNTMVAPGGEFIAGGTGAADSCFGDSGGPVYLETSHGTVVIGAVSRGVNNSPTPCGGGGIYVRTDKIVQWIEQTAGKRVSQDDCTGTGTGSGSGGGSGTGEGGDEVDQFGDVSGGCNAGGDGSGSLAFVLGALGLGLVVGRRRGACGVKPAEAKPAEDFVGIPPRR